ncbi:MAG TPA: alpha/beta fold hydrolase [Myxococcales bacterium]|nr:alpha/beta fold hydrolase [Myxococcales bacterium]
MTAPASLGTPALQRAPSPLTSRQTGATGAPSAAPVSLKSSDRFDAAPARAQGLFGGGVLDVVRGGINALFGRDSTGQIGWMEKANLPPTRDITSDFRDTYAAQRIGANVLPPEAKDYVYLTVDGLTGENFPGYMEANREGLRDRGLDVREIKVDTEASTLTNAETIRKAIESVKAEGKQVVLIGHSKGGNDITAAIALHPELKSSVRAVVTMQSPYGGAPLATDLRSDPITRLGVDALAKYIFNGDPDCVRDLTYAWRQKFIQEHPYPTDIPTVSLATSSDSQLSLVAAAADYAKLRYGEKTDGLVSPRDAWVPGANVVTLPDLDHVNSTLPNVPQLSHWEPGDLTVALVAMALKYPPVAQ